MTEYKTDECLNCFRYFGEHREVLQSGSGVWVHNIPPMYPDKCHIWHDHVAVPKGEA